MISGELLYYAGGGGGGGQYLGSQALAPAYGCEVSGLLACAWW